MFRDFLGQARAPRLRTIRQFAEADVVIPEGRYAGRKFRVDRAPWAGHFFDAVAAATARGWNRFASTGPVQSGKTLSTVVIPALWHLFEWRESVILGVPSMDMAYDKWRKEFLPVILASPALRKFLPSGGRGSRGGNFDSITFTNGATLKIMSGHGGDEKRSAYTARVVVITEADKMDEAGESSREADPITQLEARTASFADEKRIYMECTVSFEEGRIWREYESGTHTQIVCTCPGCGADQVPEREQLTGWSPDEAADELAAAQQAAFHCTACGIVWDDDDRRQMNLASRYEIRRERTNTFSYRWSAWHNLFWPAGFIGAKEWRRAQYDADDSTAEPLERELRQFFWAVPAEPDRFAAIDLDAHALCLRHDAADGERPAERLIRGIVPSDAIVLTMGIDLGKHSLHWVLIAWRPNGVAHVVDYGVAEIPGQTMAVDRAVLTGLLQFTEERIKPGWPDLRQKTHWPAAVLVDAGYQTDAVFEFCRRIRREDPSHPKRFLPSYGRGTSQTKSAASPLLAADGKVVFRGDHYTIRKQTDRGGAYAVWPNTDHWKSMTHERLATPAGEPGSLVFYVPAQPKEHLGIAKQLTAEKVIREFVEGKGIVDKWVNESRSPNHYFDATYNGLLAGHLCGQGVREPVASSGQAVAPQQPFTLPDGRPYFVGDRQG